MSLTAGDENEPSFDLKTTIREIKTSLAAATEELAQLNPTDISTLSTTLDALADDVEALETAIEDYLPLAGGTMTGPLNMGAERITGYTGTTYADNAAALLGGLAVGDIYAVTTTGVLQVVVAGE